MRIGNARYCVICTRVCKWMEHFFDRGLGAKKKNISIVGNVQRLLMQQYAVLLHTTRNWQETGISAIEFYSNTIYMQSARKREAPLAIASRQHTRTSVLREIYFLHISRWTGIGRNFSVCLQTVDCAHLSILLDLLGVGSVLEPGAAMHHLFCLIPIESIQFLPLKKSRLPL